MDEVFVGETALSQDEVMDLLELEPTSGRDALTSAVAVAELNLAAGGHADLERLYAAHAWLLTDDGSPELDGEASSMASSLERGTCL